MGDLIQNLKTLYMAQEGVEGEENGPGGSDAILAENIEVTENLEMNERAYQGTPGVRQPVPGAQMGVDLTFDAEMKGNGSNTICELDEVLQACFGSVAAANLDSTISGTAGAAGVWDVADVANASEGSLVMLETATADTYEVALITAKNAAATPDDLTVSPNAVNGAYATNGKKVKEMRTFQILLPPTAVNSMTADVFYSAVSGASNQRDRLVGLRGSWKMASPGAGQIPKFSFAFKGWSVSRATDATRQTPEYDSALPKASKASAFRVDGVYTPVWDISFDLGAEVALKLSQNSPQGVYGTPHVRYRPSGSFKVHPSHDSTQHFTDLEAGTAHNIMFQVGNTLYGTWAIFVPKAVWTNVTRPDASGVGALEIEWVAADQDDALATAGDAALYLGVG